MGPELVILSQNVRRERPMGPTLYEQLDTDLDSKRSEEAGPSVREVGARVKRLDGTEVRIPISVNSENERLPNEALSGKICANEVEKRTSPRP